MKKIFIILFSFITIDIVNLYVMAGKNIDNQNQLKVNNFSFVIIPDTQGYTISEKNMIHLKRQIDWIRDNYKNENISLITHVGDIIEYPYPFLVSRIIKKTKADFICSAEIWKYTSKDNKLRWDRASNQFARLQNLTRKIPISFVSGNHDYSCHARKASNNSFLNYFGPENFIERNWFLDSDKTGYNSAQKLYIGGKHYIHIGLEYLPSDKAIEFAQKIIMQNPNIPVIITTHYYLQSSRIIELKKNQMPSKTNSPMQLYKKLIDTFPQIFLVISGHKSQEGLVINKTSLDRDVIQIIANYQYDPEGGNGWFKILKFKPKESTLEIATISPTYIPGVTFGPDHSKSKSAQRQIIYDINGLHNYLNSRKILTYRQGQTNQSKIKYFGTIENILTKKNNLSQKFYNLLFNKDKVVIKNKNNRVQLGLLKFEDFIGGDNGQINPNTKIEKALLTITSDSTGHLNAGIFIHEMNEYWDQNTSWDDLDNRIEINSKASAKSISIKDSTIKGTNTFDVTHSVQKWINGSINNGWVFAANKNALWSFKSSKWKTLVERPMLTIIYENKN